MEDLRKEMRVRDNVGACTWKDSVEDGANMGVGGENAPSRRPRRCTVEIAAPRFHMHGVRHRNVTHHAKAASEADLIFSDGRY